MKIQKFVPILLASALLVSCKTPTQLSQVPLLVMNNLHPLFCQAKKAQLQLPLKLPLLK